MTTDATPPQRSGMAPWAKWSLFGCGGCLTVAVVMVIVFAVFIGRNMKFEQFNVSDKPDPPPAATANQLLPRQVGPFTLRDASRPTGEQGSSTRGWQGDYTAGARRVTVVVMPTAEAKQHRDARSPFGSALQRTGNDPNQGFLMSMNIGGQSMEMVVWQKPNWTVVIQSQDNSAAEFARAYRPAGGR
jgi:hypothetical protein